MKAIQRLPLHAIGLIFISLAIYFDSASFAHKNDIFFLAATAAMGCGVATLILAGGFWPARELKLLAEIRRLRRGLRWYAEQQHMVLGGWEEPDEPGWLCPPGSKEDMIEEVENGLPWMVEDGGVARIILRGGSIFEENGKPIARLDPKDRRDENGRTLIRCYEFNFGNAPLLLRETDSVHQFAEVFGADPNAPARELLIRPRTLTKRQFQSIPDWGAVAH